ncbi:putative glycosyltransferase [Burkholderia cepacia]|uniref:Glycosyltransferase n=2 Tax=Burkholderiaceae TaxID=119060 RepID=A0AA89CGU5_BURCE|nr:putative glycosyltransferase [Burkholderia cepacia]
MFWIPNSTEPAAWTRTATHSVTTRAGLVLETHNLRADAGREQAVDGLKHLVTALPRQTVPQAALAHWIITHDGVLAKACAEITALAGRPIDFVKIGASAATSMRRATASIASMPIAATSLYSAMPIAGRPMTGSNTCSRRSRRARRGGRANQLCTQRARDRADIDRFHVFPEPTARRRDVFSRFSYEPLDGVYRTHCQVLGLRMQAAGVAVEFAPAAHTEHRVPDTHRESLKFAWMRDEDSVGLTPYFVNAYLPRQWQWRGGPFFVMPMRLGYSLRVLNCQQLPQLGAVRYLEAVGVTIAASAVDTLSHSRAASDSVDVRRPGAISTRCPVTANETTPRIAAGPRHFDILIPSTMS